MFLIRTPLFSSLGARTSCPHQIFFILLYHKQRIHLKEKIVADIVHPINLSLAVHREYIARINRVVDFIETHLTESLSLTILSEVACFSPFHFHRIFKGMMGETINQYIQRVRVEKAASQLQNNPLKSITEIAMDCGFSGSARFARVFREMYGMSASEWRVLKRCADSKICKQNRNPEELNSKNQKDHFPLFFLY